MYTYKYPRPAVTTDAVVWGLDVDSGQVDVLLIRRKNPPFQGHYALPGGFLDENESAEDCVVRELAEETGLTDVPKVQMRTFSQPGRDPRGHTVSVVFFSMIDRAKYNARAGDDAGRVEWVSLSDIARKGIDMIGLQDADSGAEVAEENHGSILLAFDHYQIIAYSALFVYRSVFMGCDFSVSESPFYPFASVLDGFDLARLEKICKGFSHEFHRFRNG